jgi:uncharacterized protein YecE (DUF72 family)
MKKTGNFWSGTSGLVLAESNKKSFPLEYRDKSRLVYYASQQNSIEINSSFYKIPRPETYKKWYEAVGEPFEFTIKLWKGITHIKGCHWQFRDLKKFMEAVDQLGDKKGCLLVQFPRTVKRDLLGLGHLLESIRKLDPEGSLRIALEFRHAQWYQPDLLRMADEFRTTLVLHDMPGSSPLKINTGAAFVYYRFHGEQGDYRGSYPASFLLRKAAEIRSRLDQGLDVYAYFNNTLGGALDNLLTLNEMVNALIMEP